MQLVAYGAQDVYLTGNPQITFFKVVYRRHTNFSVECIEQTFNGNVNFGKSVNCTISRNGDLISQVFLKVSLPAVDFTSCCGEFAYCPNFGFALIDNVSCEIGGTTIDKQYGEWMYIWNQLAGESSTSRGLDNMIGNVPALTKLTGSKDAYTLYVPLFFWFCRNNGLALPLIALQYHEVKVKLQFRTAQETISYRNGTRIDNIELDDASLLVDYIYLDSEERKRFAQASHEYLIEQIQHTGHETINQNSNKIRLNFNHPCKFLAWNVKRDQGKSVQRAVWDNNPDNLREKLGRFISLLSCYHDNAGKLLEENGCGEAKKINWPEETPMAELHARAEAIVATNNGVSSLECCALMSNNLTSDDMTLDVCDLKKIYEASVQKLGEDVGNVDHLFDNYVNVVNPFDYALHADGTGNPFKEAQLQLNGHDRFSKRDGNYFNYVQPWQHFSNTPADGINVYSFALNPEEHQPSGSCNMSRIDNATLSFDSNTGGSFYIYAVNYNVLRIMSGMGGLAYSN
jgi:hypothetical protein